MRRWNRFGIKLCGAVKLKLCRNLIIQTKGPFINLINSICVGMSSFLHVRPSNITNLGVEDCSMWEFRHLFHVNISILKSLDIPTYFPTQSQHN